MEVARCDVLFDGGEDEDGAIQEANVDVTPLFAVCLPLSPSLLVLLLLLSILIIDDNDTGDGSDCDDPAVLTPFEDEHIPCEPSRIGRCICSKRISIAYLTRLLPSTWDGC